MELSSHLSGIGFEAEVETTDMKEQLYIGTSGYSYPAWKKVFYPDKMPSSQWLSYFSEQFNTLELNSSFYNFPRVATLKKMHDATNPYFLFSIKMNRLVTHYQRLKNSKEKVDEFIQTAEEGFGEKLGCILFQLPPSFKFTEENLENLLECVPHEKRCVIEFRNISWWENEVFEALKKHKLTFCNVSFPGLPEEIHMTTDLFYLRMHGVPELFKSRYSEEELKAKAEAIPEAEHQLIYFNNTMFEAGYTNARELRTLMT